jgi:hypothetical protein
MILILSRDLDEEVFSVTSRLDRAGGDYTCFDPTHYPSRAALSMTHGSGGIYTRVLRWGEFELDLERVTAIWDRSAGRPVADPRVLDPHQRSWLEREAESFLLGVWETLDCFWVPVSPLRTWKMENRAYHLHVAAQIGFRIPGTLVTNSPQDFLDFYRTNQGNLIDKVLSDPSVKKCGELHRVRTRRIARRDAAHYLAISFAPVLFQEYVARGQQVSVTVIGQRVFAAVVPSEKANRAERGADQDSSINKPSLHRLPPRMQQQCVRILQELGLSAGEVRLLFTSQGEYFFLGIQPASPWAWLERLTDRAISDAICNLLLSAAPAIQRDYVEPESGNHV